MIYQSWSLEREVKKKLKMMQRFQTWALGRMELAIFEL